MQGGDNLFWILVRNLCPEGTDYCWMGCLPLPNPPCGENESLACFSVENDYFCQDDAHMDPTCNWECIVEK